MLILVTLFYHITNKTKYFAPSLKNPQRKQKFNINSKQFENYVSIEILISSKT